MPLENATRSRPKIGDEVQHAGSSAPYGRMLHTERFECKPDADVNQLRHQHGQQVTLDLHVDLIEYQRGILQRTSEAPTSCTS